MLLNVNKRKKRGKTWYSIQFSSKNMFKDKPIWFWKVFKSYEIYSHYVNEMKVFWLKTSVFLNACARLFNLCLAKFIKSLWSSTKTFFNLIKMNISLERKKQAFKALLRFWFRMKLGKAFKFLHFRQKLYCLLLKLFWLSITHD